MWIAPQAQPVVEQEPSVMDESMDQQAQVLLDMLKEKTQNYKEPKLEDLARDFRISKLDFYNEYLCLSHSVTLKPGEI